MASPLTIRLFGPPAVERDGEPVRPPRGRKSWALLAYVLLTPQPRSRGHLAELLFGDADDPLAALRWTLSELRRAIGPHVLRGDPVDATLDGVLIDVRDLAFPDGELLEGVRVDACPEFESWLLVERHRASAAIAARLRETAVSLLAAAQPEDAISYASRAVARHPLDEDAHELLIRCLATSGDHAAALRQVAVCEDLFRRELGVVPSPVLADAARATSTSTTMPTLHGRAAIVSQLEAGRAAIAAGAVDAGIECLRRAVAEAKDVHDAALWSRTLVTLGGALVHAARGRDGEGTLVLHQAIAVATRAGDRGSAVTAHRELGFVDVQAGRRVTAEGWLTKAQHLAETDEELAAILGVRGMSASDRGDYPAAFEHLAASIDHAVRCADRRQQAWSLSIRGRAHLLRAESSQAAADLAASLDLVREQRWIAFQPWPQTLRAELALSAGHPDTAAEDLQQAWTLGCQLNDPCWEGMAARGLGLLHAGRGDHGTAATWFAEAATRSNRVPDRYQWVRAYVLDATITSALDRGDYAAARPLVETLASLAARCDMQEFVMRTYLHRDRLGEHHALAAARLLGADIDNPALAHAYQR